MTDDRDEFEKANLENARRMAEDEPTQRLNLDLLEASDRFDFSYMWSWMGLPIIQRPTDIVVMQEILWRTRPQLVIETGVARGGSLIFYSSILELLGDGLVVGIDIDLRDHNRQAIVEHPLSKRIRLIDGSSTSPEVLKEVRGVASGAARVMAVLDSNHTESHVLDELNAYGPLVSEGMFLVVADTAIEQLPPLSHRPRPWGPGNNAGTAVNKFLQQSPDFVREPYFNSKLLMSSSPGGYLLKVKA